MDGLGVVALVYGLLVSAQGVWFGYLFGMTAVGWVVAAFWLPTMIAHERKSNRHTTVAVINLFGGWLLGTGWVVALIIALASSSREDARA